MPCFSIAKGTSTIGINIFPRSNSSAFFRSFIYIHLWCRQHDRVVISKPASQIVFESWWRICLWTGGWIRKQIEKLPTCLWTDANLLSSCRWAKHCTSSLSAQGQRPFILDLDDRWDNSRGLLIDQKWERPDFGCASLRTQILEWVRILLKQNNNKR